MLKLLAVFLATSINLIAQEFKGIITEDNNIGFHVKFKDNYEATCKLKDVIFGRQSNDQMTPEEKKTRWKFLDKNWGGYWPELNLAYTFYWDHAKKILVFGIEPSIKSFGLNLMIFIWKAGINDKPRFVTTLNTERASDVRFNLSSVDGNHLAFLLPTNNDLYRGELDIIDVENVHCNPINLNEFIIFDPKYFTVVSKTIWASTTKLNITLDIYTHKGELNIQNRVATTCIDIDFNNGRAVIPKKKLKIKDEVKNYK